jgi:hypothetical protein
MVGFLFKNPKVAAKEQTKAKKRRKN